jgi:hypothetical protein
MQLIEPSRMLKNSFTAFMSFGSDAYDLGYLLFSRICQVRGNE